MNRKSLPKSGRWRYSLIALAISLPIAIAVPAILYRLFWDDITDDSAGSTQIVATYRGFDEAGLIFQGENGTMTVGGVPPCNKWLTARNIGQSFVLHFKSMPNGDSEFEGLSLRPDEAMSCYNGQT